MGAVEHTRRGTRTGDLRTEDDDAVADVGSVCRRPRGWRRGQHDEDGGGGGNRRDEATNDKGVGAHHFTVPVSVSWTRRRGWVEPIPSTACFLLSERALSQIVES